MKKLAWIPAIGAGLVAACVTQPQSPPAAPAAESSVVTAPAAEAPARPEQTADGRWRVSVLSVRKPENATRWVRKLEAEGFRVATETAEVNGETWTRVVLPGLRTLDDARQMVTFVEHQYTIAQVWVPPRQSAAATAETPKSEGEAEKPAAGESDASGDSDASDS